MFIEDYRISPTEAKAKFNLKFPNIHLTKKEINTYIIVKYRETKNINNNEILNTDNLFILKVTEGNILSHVIKFNIEVSNEELKFIIIGNDEIFKNIKNNHIDQYFMDCTYKPLPKIFKI